ncbi:hypothetical protein RsTz2092_12040 [Deferribacterales bacterium RsTz2092]
MIYNTGWNHQTNNVNLHLNVSSAARYQYQPYKTGSYGWLGMVTSAPRRIGVSSIITDAIHRLNRVARIVGDYKRSEALKRRLASSLYVRLIKASIVVQFDFDYWRNLMSVNITHRSERVSFVVSPRFVPQMHLLSTYMPNRHLSVTA